MRVGTVLYSAAANAHTTCTSSRRFWRTRDATSAAGLHAASRTRTRPVRSARSTSTSHSRGGRAALRHSTCSSRMRTPPLRSATARSTRSLTLQFSSTTLRLSFHPFQLLVEMESKAEDERELTASRPNTPTLIVQAANEYLYS